MHFNNLANYVWQAAQSTFSLLVILPGTARRWPLLMHIGSITT